MPLLGLVGGSAKIGRARRGNPSGGTVYFESYWETATGNSQSAVTDGAAWGASAPACSTWPDVLSVIEVSTLGITAPTGIVNGMRAQMLVPAPGPGSDCGMPEKSPAVPESTSHWGRVFMVNLDSAGGSGDKNDHNFAYNNVHPASDIQIPFQRYANVNTTQWQWGTIFNNVRFYSPFLDNDVWYCLEWNIVYQSATSYNIYLYVSDRDGTELYDSSDFTSDSDGTLAAYNAANPSGLPLANGGTPDAALAREFGMGNEGPSTAQLGCSGNAWVYAGLALTSERIGAAV